VVQPDAVAHRDAAAGVIMNNIVPIRGKYDNWRALIADVVEKYPDPSIQGVITVFDADGGMHTYFKASDQQMALAASRLIHLVNTD
jgi:hypothetical protein